MSSFSIRASIFDPATPFERRLVSNTCIDTWYQTTLITRTLRGQVPEVEDEGTDMVRLSAGMRMQAPVIRIGLQLGDLRLTNLRALVVDEGHYDLVLGTQAIERALRVGGGDSGAMVAAPEREAPGCLAVELHPLRVPTGASRLETFLRGARRLYELLMLVEERMPLGEPPSLDGVSDLEPRVPAPAQMTVQYLGFDPLWVTLGGEPVGLRSLADAFPTGAVARLASEAAGTQDLAERAAMVRARRGGTVVFAAREQEAYGRERLLDTWNQWTRELPEKLAPYEGRMEAFEGRDLREDLVRLRDAAVADLTSAELMPIVRCLPDSPS